jgi:GPH family glycoside/pentoside/hexuronide:cation symporter
MVHNPIWWIAVVFELLIFVRLGMLAPAMVFYAKEVLHAPQVASVLLPVMSAAILTGGLLAPPYLSRFGKRKGMYLLLGFTILMFVAMAFAQSRFLLLALFFLGTAGNGIQAAMVFTMVTEAVELQERRFGSREEGLMSCSTAFTQKVGFALGGALLGYVLAYVGYDPHQLKPGVSVALTALVVGVPIVVAVLQMLCISFYRLDLAPLQSESTHNNWTTGRV